MQRIWVLFPQQPRENQKIKGQTSTKIGGIAKISYSNGKQNRGGAATLIMNKTGFRLKFLIRDKDHYMKVFNSFIGCDNYEYIYTPNIGGPKYIQQIFAEL